MVWSRAEIHYDTTLLFRILDRSVERLSGFRKTISRKRHFKPLHHTSSTMLFLNGGLNIQFFVDLTSLGSSKHCQIYPKFYVCCFPPWLNNVLLSLAGNGWRFSRMSAFHDLATYIKSNIGQIDLPLYLSIHPSLNWSSPSFLDHWNFSYTCPFLVLSHDF